MTCFEIIGCSSDIQRSQDTAEDVNAKFACRPLRLREKDLAVINDTGSDGDSQNIDTYSISLI
jgi:hypothetical protein